jgi:hypothetical protein
MRASYVLTLPVRVIFPLVAKVSFFAAVYMSSFPIHPECALICVNMVRRSREARNGTQQSRVATPIFCEMTATLVKGATNRAV